jgi:WD40 repeat protein
VGDRIGQQFGNYRLVKLLGHGGFAEVYLGEHQLLQRQAAIKVLQTSLAQEDKDDFLKEARIIAQLEHPHIIDILDFDVQDSIPYLVMRYAPNGNIRQRHPKGTVLPLPAVVDYVRQVSSALQYAHNAKFIHRDIKPENLLVGRHQELLLSDFGIALIAQSSRLQSTQEVAGTAAYMAPEQFQGKPRLASDQYALGIVVYEWLCGTRPFHGSFTEIASQHLFAALPPLREQVPDLPPGIEQVVQTALAKDPAQRFASVQDFASTLEQYILPRPITVYTSPYAETRPEPSNALFDASTQPSSLPKSQPAETSLSPQQLPDSPNQVALHNLSSRSSLSSPSPTAPTQPENPSTSPISLVSPVILTPQSRSRVKRRTVVAGLAVLAMASGGAYWLNQSQHPAVKISPAGTLLYTYRGHSFYVSGVAWSPDGKRIASASFDETVQVWNATNGSSPFIYKGHYSPVFGAAWSPDGKRIASASNERTVQVWNATNGSSPFIYKGHSFPVNNIAWSPDSKRIASAGFDKTVQVWNAANGSSPFIYKGHSASANSVAWSPDGQRIASASSDETVQVWNPADGSDPFVYKGHSGSVNSVAWSPDGQRIASASSDQTVQVWNAADGSTPYIYKGHSAPVRSTAWSPDGKRIASAGEDHTVQIWNSIDGSSPYIYKGHSNNVRSVAWSPNGLYIASASDDHTVHIWSAG